MEQIILEGTTQQLRSMLGSLKTWKNLILRNQAYLNLKSGPKIDASHAEIEMFRLLIINLIFLGLFLSQAGAENTKITDLMWATINEDVDKVKKLVGSGANVNAKDEFGNTALMYAAGSHLHASEKQLENGAKTEKRWLDIMKFLLKNGADPNEKNKNNRTSLSFAVYHGREEGVQTLINYGANLNFTNTDGWSYLMIASYHCYYDIARILLRNGAKKNLRDNFGDRAIDLARKRDCPEVVKLLQH